MNITSSTDLASLYGERRIMDKDSHMLFDARLPDFDVRRVIRHWHNHLRRQVLSMRRGVLESVGCLAPTLHFAMGFDHRVRIGLKREIGHVSRCGRVFAATVLRSRRD